MKAIGLLVRNTLGQIFVKYKELKWGYTVTHRNINAASPELLIIVMALGMWYINNDC